MLFECSRLMVGKEGTEQSTSGQSLRAAVSLEPVCRPANAKAAKDLRMRMPLTRKTANAKGPRMRKPRKPASCESPRSDCTFGSRKTPSVAATAQLLRSHAQHTSKRVAIRRAVSEQSGLRHPRMPRMRKTHECESSECESPECESQCESPECERPRECESSEVTICERPAKAIGQNGLLSDCYPLGMRMPFGSSRTA
jgi:hypothetical protein